MERYRLKNIIIIILVLVNLSLLSSLGVRKTAEQTAHRRVQEEMEALFAADGIKLDGTIIPDDMLPMPITMSRDSRRERNVAEFFLGEALQNENQGGGIYSYTGGSGVALFRGDGSFDVVGASVTEELEPFCESFCRAFSYGDPVFTLDETGTGSAVAVYQYERQTVPNCVVTFNIVNGTLQTVSGTLLPENGLITEPEQEMLAASAALTVFQKMRRETGAVVSEVAEIYSCYRLQSTAAVPMSLTPAWCIVTDTSRYHVNGISGTISTG